MLSEKEKPGLWGEIYAARFMRENGYEIITANYRCRLGEIDICLLYTSPSPRDTR